MNGFVIELQRFLLSEDCDLLLALRKAHVIARKLHLYEFDEWLLNELNGYTDVNKLPNYRIVHGSAVAKNPYYGFIPVSFSDQKIEELCTKRSLFEPISGLIELVKTKKKDSIYIRYPGKIEQIILNSFDIDLPVYLEINTRLVLNIIESVKNCLIEWTLKLESEGIVGENMVFQDSEKETAKSIPQQINNYYGTIVNGNVEHSQVISGQNHTIEYHEAQKAVSEVKEAIEKENVNTEDKETALALLEDISNKIAQEKKPSVIKVTAKALGGFLKDVGAAVAAEMVMAKIEGRF